MKRLTTAEARELGVVIEVNRQLLHPRGLALEVMVSDGDEAILVTSMDSIAWIRDLINYVREAHPEWAHEHKERLDETHEVLGLAEWSPAILRVQDHRDDPEGVYFAGLEASDVEHSQTFADSLLPEREAALGYVVQPLESVVG